MLLFVFDIIVLILFSFLWGVKILFRTLRATAAPSTYGPGSWGETPIADHPLIQTLVKTWTNSEHQQNNIDEKIDAKSFQEDTRRAQDHHQDRPGPQPGSQKCQDAFGKLQPWISSSQHANGRSVWRIDIVNEGWKTA